jgi:CHAT domain-containing protein/Tfp pilus assembly protein PilF
MRTGADPPFPTVTRGTLLLLIAVLLAASSGPLTTMAAAGQQDLVALIDAGKYADAERAARVQLKDLEGRGTADTVIADVVDALVESLMRQGKGTPEAKTLAERAVAIRTATSPDSAALARSLNLLANIVELQGDIKSARDQYERAAEIAMRALGPSDSMTANLRKDLAIAYRGLGDYGKAKAILLAALADREKVAPDHVDIGKLQHNLGAVLWELGEFEAARDAFGAAVERVQAVLGPDHPHVATAREGLAVVHIALGDYAAARAAHERVLASREKSLGPAHPDVGYTLANLGDVLAAFGDNDAARTALERAIAIWERALPPDNPVLTVGLTNLGVVLDRMGDRAGARRALERGIAIREKTLSGDHAELVVPLTQLANVIADGGDLPAAAAIYARARAIAEKARGAAHPYVATAAYEEGIRLARTGEYGRARPLLEQSYAIRTRALGPDHPATAESVDALARLEAATGTSARASEMALLAERVAREHFRATAAALPERQALLYAEQRTRSQDLAILLMRRAPARSDTEVETLWNAVIGSRALVLDEMAWRQRTSAAASDTETRELSRQLADARARLSRLILDPPGPGGSRNTIAEARDRKERLEQSLAARNATYREAIDQRGVGFSTLRQRLPQGTALVAYVRYAATVYPGNDSTAPQEYAAFVLSTDRRAAFVPLGAAAGVERAVESWRQRIREEATAPAPGRRRSEQLYRDTAASLRRRVWDPLAPLLSGASQVLIVPDGSLSLVHFASLPAGSGSYVAERGPILHYLSTERDVLQPARTPGTGLLAVGAPAYGEPADRERTARGGCVPAIGPFLPLPETGPEADFVAALSREHGNAAVVLTGAKATESEVKSLAPGKRILHLATHGFFADTPCANGGNRWGDSPLSRTGLALAGASRPMDGAREDGILTGEEITALDLRGVEWAVLSACESGLGEVHSGEGVLGLRRALFVAGAHTIVMSLWQVDDATARSWMERAYRARLQRRQPTASAIRTAERELLSSRRQEGASTHPFYWAGFVAVGDWR